MVYRPPAEFAALVEVDRTLWKTRHLVTIAPISRPLCDLFNIIPHDAPSVPWATHWHRDTSISLPALATGSGKMVISGNATVPQNATDPCNCETLVEKRNKGKCNLLLTA